MARTPAHQPHWAEGLALDLLKQADASTSERQRKEADTQALTALVCAQGPAFLDRLAGALTDAADYFNRVLDRAALRVTRSDIVGEVNAAGICLQADYEWRVAVYPSWSASDPDPALRIARRDVGSFVVRFQANDGELQVVLAGASLNADQLAENIVLGTRLTELVG